MCRRQDIDERRLVAAETNTAIALDELDVSRVTLGARLENMQQGRQSAGKDANLQVSRAQAAGRFQQP